jgi:hypothetical protein
MQFDDASRQLTIRDRWAVEREVVGDGARAEEILRQIEHPIGPSLWTIRLARVYFTGRDHDHVPRALRHGPVAIANLARAGYDRAEPERLVQVWREAVTRVGSSEDLERRVPRHDREARRLRFVLHRRHPS